VIKSIFGSVVGKVTAVTFLLSGVGGGMAVTGALPGIGQAPTYSVASVASAPTGPGVALDFPTSVIAAPSVEAAAVPEIVEEVVVIAAPRKVSAPAPAAPAAPAAPQCVADLTNVLNAITAAIPTITTGEQGQVLLAQANAVVAAGTECVNQAKQVGFPGADGVNQLVAQAGGLVTQIQALPVVAALTPEQLAQTPNIVGGVVGGVGQVVGGTLNMVNKGLGLLGTGLNLLTSPAK
jgi:hypothetical protein